MKTKDFLKKHDACTGGAKWALSIGGDMAVVWDAMIEQGRHGWLVWAATRPGVFSDSILRKLACRFVRETPIADGRKVWDLLTDERSSKAVEVAESYADGKATAQELDAACNAAYAVAYDADAAYAVAYDAAAADAAARAAVSFDDARAAVSFDDARAAVYAAYAAYAAARAAVSFDDARAAAYAADAAAYAAYAAYDADDAAYDAAKVAQAQMIVEKGNPFKERSTDD